VHDSSGGASGPRHSSHSPASASSCPSAALKYQGC